MAIQEPVETRKEAEQEPEEEVAENIVCANCRNAFAWNDAYEQQETPGAHRNSPPGTGDWRPRAFCPHCGFLIAEWDIDPSGDRNRWMWYGANQDLNREQALPPSPSRLWGHSIAAAARVTLDEEFLDLSAVAALLGDREAREREKAKAIPPDDLQEHVKRGFLHLEDNQLEEAIAQFEHCLELEPDHAAAHRGMGWALYLNRGAGDPQINVDKALSHLQQAIDLDPQAGEAHFYLGIIHHNEAREQEAIAEWRKALELRLPPDKEAAARSNLAEKYIKRDRLAEAVAHFEKARDLDPSLFAPHAYLAIIYDVWGEADKAAHERREADKTAAGLALTASVQAKVRQLASPGQPSAVTPAVSVQTEEERVYPWRGKSKLRRAGLALAAIAAFFLCSGSAGYAMMGFDPGLVVRVLVLIWILSISGRLMFDALRPTSVRELAISPDRGLIFRRKKGEEKPVIAQITKLTEASRGKKLVIQGRSPEDEYVRAEVEEHNLDEEDFENFKRELHRLVPGEGMEPVARPSLARRVLAGLATLPAALGLVGFLFAMGATIHDYVKGIESASIPYETQVLITLGLLGAFLLFAALSVVLSGRRRRMVVLWSAFLVVGLVATGGIVAYLLRGEQPGGEPPAIVAPAATTAAPMHTATPGSPGTDHVVAYNPGLAQNAQHSDPQAALGAPDLVEEPCCSGMLQLGAGGSVLLAFTDNVIYDRPGPDFQVFGESARDDYILVEVSGDGQEWHAYPKTNESPEPFDLADLGLEQAVFVRITDLQPGTPTGAELDAVQALHNGSPLAGGLPTDLPDAMARTDLVLREDPGQGSFTLSEVPSGTSLTVHGCNADGTWAMVATSDAEPGWCQVMHLALNVSLGDYLVVEEPGGPTPAPSTPTPPAKRVDLAEAQAQSLAQITVTGQGLEWIKVALESLSEEPLEVAIQPGTIFHAQSAGTQNMVVRRQTVVFLSGAGASRSVEIPVACANMQLGVPEETDQFTISTAPSADDLMKLLVLPGFLDEPFRVQQFAIWTITDNPARGGYVGLGYFGVGSGPDDEEMQRIRALFEQAGIPTDRYQAFQ